MTSSIRPDSATPSPRAETSVVRSGDAEKVLRNPARKEGKGFEKTSVQRGKRFEKVVRKGSLRRTDRMKC